MQKETTLKNAEGFQDYLKIIPFAVLRFST